MTAPCIDVRRSTCPFVDRDGCPTLAYDVFVDGRAIGVVYDMRPGWCASHRGSDGWPDHPTVLHAVSAVLSDEGDAK
jgi:hypothetical protein